MRQESINSSPDASAENEDGGRILSAAARRALAEAEERRKTARAGTPAPEVSGRGGLDPVRYGDWEIKGLASDF